VRRRFQTPQNGGSPDESSPRGDVSKFLQLNGHDKADLAGRHLVKRERQPKSRLPPSTALAVVRNGHFAQTETDQWINRLSLWL
jgi:hypothetical protein